MMDGQLRIQSLWAFTCVDADGSEGIVAVELPGLGVVPLVGADLARVASLRPYAQDAATKVSRSVLLSHFSLRTDQERLQP
jgi:hypothetical protein